MFFGCGTAIMTTARGDFDYTGTALAFGLTVLVGAYAFGRVSGAHFNPAVSLGAALGGRMAWREVPLYVGSQLVGALAAGLSLFVLIQGFEGYDVGVEGLAQNSFGDDGTGYAMWAAFLIELLMTAVFVWVILAVTDVRNEHPALAPAAIGLALTMIHFASITATGTSVNPARSIGVGVFAGTDAIIQLWLFILAPLVGAAIAGITYPMLFGHGAEPVPGSGLRRAAPAAVPGYGAPDQFQQEWNQAGHRDRDHPGGSPRSRSSRTAGSGTTRHRSGSRWSSSSSRRPTPRIPPRRTDEGREGPVRVRTSARLVPVGPSRLKVRTRPTPSSYDFWTTLSGARSLSTRRITCPSSTLSTVARSSTTPSSSASRQPSPTRGSAGMARPASAPATSTSQTPARPNHHTFPSLSCA